MPKTSVTESLSTFNSIQDAADAAIQAYGFPTEEPPVSTMARCLIDNNNEVIFGIGDPNADSLDRALLPSRLPVTAKFRVDGDAIATVGAVAEGDLPLGTLPPNSVVMFTTIQPFENVYGGTLSEITGQVRTVDHVYGDPVTLFQALGQHGDTDGVKGESLDYSTVLNLHLVATDDDLGSVLGGVVFVYVTYFTRL